MKFALLVLSSALLATAGCSDDGDPLVDASVDTQIDMPADQGTTDQSTDQAVADIAADSAPDTSPDIGPDVGPDAPPPNWEIVGVTGGDLVTVNKTTAATTMIGSLGGPTLGFLSYDATTGILYGLDIPASTLYSLNACTGAATSLGTFMLPGSTLFQTESIVVDPSSGIAYAAADTTNDGRSETLMSVDLNTFVGTSIAGITGTPQNDADLMFYVGSTLYVSDSYGSPFDSDLHTFDTTTGVATVIATASPRAHLRGFAHDPVTGVTYATDSTANMFYTIDVSTAQVTAVAALTGFTPITMVNRQCP